MNLFPLGVHMDVLVATCSMKSYWKGKIYQWIVHTSVLAYLFLNIFDIANWSRFWFVTHINSPRCVEAGVSYLNTKVERIIEASGGHRLVECEDNVVISCRCAYCFFLYLVYFVNNLVLFFACASDLHLQACYCSIGGGFREASRIRGWGSEGFSADSLWHRGWGRNFLMA